MSCIIICKLVFLLLLIIAICKFSWGQQQDVNQLEDVPVDPKCYQDMINANPTLRDRFSDDLLRQHCRKSEVWKKQSTDNLGKSSKPLLTPAQLDWATNIWNCKDIRCLCEMFDFCKQFLKQMQGLANFTNTNQFKVPNLGGGKNSGGLPGLGNLNLGRRRRRQNENPATDFNTLLRDKVGKANRKEIRAMTNGERNRFFRAMNRLKSEKIDNMGKYDIMIVYHTPEYSPEAHFCAAFLPFHRELLKSLEMALRVVEPDTALPYWDTTLDEGLPDPKDSILWSDLFLGNGQGDVTSGPFANWTTIPDARFKPLSANLRIVRGLGTSPFGSLMKDKDIDTLLSKRTFRDFVYCVDPFTELIHGATHMWVGGYMLELRISPNDPSFFIFHTFVDYIWEQWRQQKQSRQQRESDYVSTKDACNQFAYADAPMKPFSIKVSDGLSNTYTDQLYAYEPRPVCSPQNPSCSSEFLFCDIRRYKCLSKVRLNGNCNGFDGTDICYQSRCSGGRCVPGGAVPQPATEAPRPTEARPTEPPTTRRPSFFTIGTIPPIVVPSLVTTAEPSIDKTIIDKTSKPPSPVVVIPPIGPSTIFTAQPPLVEKIDPLLPHPAGTGTTDLPVRPFTGSRFPASSATVWTPITVLAVSGQSAQPYQDAKIVTHDTDHNVQYFGRIADQSQVPYYSGAAYAQIMNPYVVNGPVEATVEVFDGANKKCISMCLNERLIYTPCQPKVRLYTDSSKSDNVPYTPNVNLAKFLNWNANKRSPDKFLFLCSPVGTTSQVRSVVPPSIVTPAATRSLPQPPEPPATPPPEVTAVPATSESSLTFLGSDKSPKSSGDGDEVIVRIITVNDEKGSRRNGGCQNAHRCCSIWAGVGECKRNPWMQDSCEKDCGVCSSGMSDVSTDNSCVDNHASCKQWTDDDQCNKNADWMDENCKASCKVCNRSVQELKRLCGGNPKTGNECKNFNDKCSDWANTDECQRNPWWMKENCPAACKAC